MMTIFILVFDGCAVAKYLIPQRFHQLLSVLNLTVPFLFLFSFGLTLVLDCHLILKGLPTKRKKQLQDKTIIAYKLRQMQAQKTKFISNKKPG